MDDFHVLNQLAHHFVPVLQVQQLVTVWDALTFTSGTGPEGFLPPVDTSHLMFSFFLRQVVVLRVQVIEVGASLLEDALNALQTDDLVALGTFV